MPVDVRSEGSRLLLLVSGELDMSISRELYDAASTALADPRAPVDEVVADLAAVHFADSVGLGTLVRLYDLAHDHGASFSMRNVGGNVARLIRMTGLDQALPISA